MGVGGSSPPIETISDERFTLQRKSDHNSISIAGSAAQWMGEGWFESIIIMVTIFLRFFVRILKFKKKKLL